MDERTVVFVAHPVRGDTEANIAAARKIFSELHLDDSIIPVAPYLARHGLIDQKSDHGHQLAFGADRQYFVRNFIEQLWLYGDHISDGMWEVVELALECFVEVVPKSEETYCDLATRYKITGRSIR